MRAWLIAGFLIGVALLASRADVPTRDRSQLDPTPVDLILTSDKTQLLVLNQGTGQLVQLDLASGKQLAAIDVGRRPSSLAITPDEMFVIVTDPYDGGVFLIRRDDGSLKLVARLEVGFEPSGVAISSKGDKAYVALRTAHAIAEIDLAKKAVVGKIATGRWPRSIAITPDATKLAVGADGDGGISVVDLVAKETLWTDKFTGMNFGQMQVSLDGQYAYFPWIVYRQNPITDGNIKLGWVLASRFARVRLDEQSRREAISLDEKGKAVADPTGMALSPDGEAVVVAAAGSHELLVMRTNALPYQAYGGPGDHIDAKLAKDKSRFRRVPLPGRPVRVRFLDDSTVLVANALTNAIDVVDLITDRVTRSISLGGPATPSLARKGEAIFYDGKRSLDQWYSCHSCHFDGRTNSVTMDTKNDGRFGNFKTVLPLVHLDESGPYFWHGWEKDLASAVKRSLKDTMLGPPPTDEDVEALVAFFKTLDLPKNPYRTPSGGLTESAQRGENLFRGSIANCAKCHSGPNLTDGKIHVVGTEERGDVYKGYNTPSLRGVYSKTRLLHDGRALTIEDVLNTHHNPERVSGNGKLSEEEMRDLVEYVKSL